MPILTFKVSDSVPEVTVTSCVPTVVPQMTTESSEFTVRDWTPSFHAVGGEATPVTGSLTALMYTFAGAV